MRSTSRAWAAPILTHSWDGQFSAEIPSGRGPAQRAGGVLSFRIMVGLSPDDRAGDLGVWDAGAAGCTNRARCNASRWMGPSGLIAMLAGWYVTEAGRQPCGVRRDAHGRRRHAARAGRTDADALALFVVVYLLVFGAGVSYMLRPIRMGPTPAPGHAPHCPADPANRASRRAPVRRLHRRRLPPQTSHSGALRWASTSH